MEFNSNKKIQTIRSIQKRLLLFLSVAHYASWHILKRNINNLCEAEPESKSLLGDNPEYMVLYPLLRTGFIEIARRPETGKLVYCPGPDVIIKMPNDKLLKIAPGNFYWGEIDKEDNETRHTINQNDSLMLLKRCPILKNVISHWVKSETEMYYIYDRFNKNHYTRIDDSTKPHMYANSNLFYSEKYIKMRDGNLYLIPAIEDNIDAVNIALCYLRVTYGQPVFIYSSHKKTISTEFFNSILPFVVCRALVLCDPILLLNENIFNRKTIINNVSREHITELKRIFNDSAVREEVNG